MKVYIANTKKKENFDTKRHILMNVDEEIKRVTVYLTCSAAEAYEKFDKAIRALGTPYRGYDIVATVPMGTTWKILMTARIH